MFGPCQGSDCQGLQIPGVVRCLRRDGFVLAVIFLFLYCPKPPQVCPREILATGHCQDWVLLRRHDSQLCSVRCELLIGKVVLGTVSLSLFSAGSGGYLAFVVIHQGSSSSSPAAINHVPTNQVAVYRRSQRVSLPAPLPASFGYQNSALKRRAHFLRGHSRSQPVSTLFPCSFLVVQLSARCYQRPARSARSAVVPTGTPPAPWPTSACPGRKPSYHRHRHLGPPLSLQRVSNGSKP